MNLSTNIYVVANLTEVKLCYVIISRIVSKDGSEAPLYYSLFDTWLSGSPFSCIAENWCELPISRNRGYFVAHWKLRRYFVSMCHVGKWRTWASVEEVSYIYLLQHLNTFSWKTLVAETSEAAHNPQKLDSEAFEVLPETRRQPYWCKYGDTYRRKVGTYIARWNFSLC